MNAFALRAAVVAAVTLSLAAAPAGAQMRLLSLAVGSSTIVSAPGMTRVAVGDGAIAGVVPAGNQLVINAKSPGRTTIAIWKPGSREDYEVVVTEPGLDTVEQIVRQSLDLPGLAVSQAPGTILVSGTVADSTQQTRVNDVLSRFDGYAKDKKVSIVNAVTIANPLGDLRRAIASDPALAGVRVEGDGKGNVVVSGSVRDRAKTKSCAHRKISGTDINGHGGSGPDRGCCNPNPGPECTGSRGFPGCSHDCDSQCGATAALIFIIFHHPPAGADVLATPATRRYAREMGVDLNPIKGTGPSGRITREDVAKMGQGVGATAAAAPKFQMPTYKPAPMAPQSGEERKPFRGIRKKIAENLVRSKQIIPHFTHGDEADVTEFGRVASSNERPC